MYALRCLAFSLAFLASVESTRIVFKDNGYEGIVIAINPEVPEDPALIDSLKAIWTNASQYLFTATKNRAFFRNVTILIPETWTNGGYNQSFNGDSYSSADVLVANSNPLFGNFPYTLQYGECGKPGQYIHMTPDYIKLDKYEFDTGIKGKVITHEWAHLRWGVYDEEATEGYDGFYLSQGSVEATRCPASLRGLNGILNYDTGIFSFCSLNQNTLLPEPGCQFFPYGNQANGIYTSLMSHQYLDSAIGFCHSDPSDRLNQHNTAAPNEHNRLCNLRSTWDVIMGTEDFANGTNQPVSNIIDTTPTFSVVQSSSTRYVLVLDVSGSMSGARLSVMKRAASLFLMEFVPDGSYVGLVSFSSYSNKLSNLQKIDDSSRPLLDNIVRKLSDGGNTGIGRGILTGLEVLRSTGSCGGNLIVLTDGGENEYPYVKDVYDDVINCDVRMHTIFLDLSSVSVNSIMTTLSVESGGGWYLVYSSSSSTDTLDIFRKLSQTDDGDKTKITYQIHTNSLSLPRYGEENGTVKIDSSIGNQTLFTFTWDSYQPSILLKTPSGCVYATFTDSNLTYCPNGPIHTVDSSLKVCKFNIPGTASVGEWIYNIKNSHISASQQAFTVTVTSMASSSTIKPIEVESRLAVTDITSLSPTVVYAKVTQGFAAVLDAEVIATVTTPSLKKVAIELYDNGASPDVRKNDGVYSRYFHQYEGQGRYSVLINVVKNSGGGTSKRSGGSPAAFNPGTIDDDGNLKPNPNGLTNLPNNTVEGAVASDFERVESGGSFSYSGPTDPGDNFAPNRVTDLSGNQVNITELDEVNGVLVSIAFTAPGDDLDSGNASMYEIRYSLENATFILNNFNETMLVEQNEVIEGNLTSPKPASASENIVFKVPNVTNEDSVQLYVAMRAYDDEGNPSEISNVRPMTLFFNKAALPVVPTAGTTLPVTLKFESTESPAETSELTDKRPTTVPTTTASIKVITLSSASSNVMLFQILTGVLGGLFLISVATVAILACKLKSVNSKLTSGMTSNGHSSTQTHHANPYA